MQVACSADGRQCQHNLRLFDINCSLHVVLVRSKVEPGKCACSLLCPVAHDLLAHVVHNTKTGHGDSLMLLMVN